MEVLSRMLKNTEMHAFMHVFRVGSNMAEGWSIYHLLLLMTPFFCCDASRLGLDNNYFGGVLPNSIVNLSFQLKSFINRGNQTYGSIPIGVENLVNISILGIGSNALVGTIPTGIGKLKSLQLLVLSRNRITRQIPPSLGKITIITI